MMSFQGFPSGEVQFTRIPEPFFSELLPQIDHLGELKVTLYFLWRLDRMGGAIRYLTEADIAADGLFMAGLAEPVEAAESLLSESLERAVERGTILRANIAQTQGDLALYFFNTPKGRGAVEAIERGEWRHTGDPQAPVELAPSRPTIYHLYEKNIGPITPMIAEALQEAEDSYSYQWIEEAFRIAVERNIRHWRYVAAILQGWQERGRDGRTDRRDTEKDRRRYAEWEED
jgi:DnaD/phage-associated family protein